MQQTADIDKAPDVAPPGTSGLIDEIKAWWDEIRHLAHDHIRLAALETRLAGESLAFMMMAGIAIAILVVSAWLALLGALAMLLIALGMWASAALLLIVLLNLVAAGILFRLIKHKSHNLKWTGTLASLKPGNKPTQDTAT